MAESLKYKTHQEPTIFNKEMAIGTMMLPIVGTFIGGMIGKRRMEDEKANGKVVSDKPGMFNKDTLLGGFIGSWAGALAGAALATAAAVALGPASAIPALAYTASIAAGVFAGGYVGGKHGQQTERQQFSQAREQQESGRIASAVSHAMQNNQEHGHTTCCDHTKKINQERAHSHEHVR